MEKFLKALFEKDLNAVKELLENGLAVNHQEPVYAHQTPVFYTAKYDFVEALNELLERGADINIFDDHKVTPLHTAAGHGSLNSLIRLLETGADPNVKDIYGRTPLHFATQALGGVDEEKGFKIVQMLLNVGAIPSIKDEKDRTPLHEASLVGNTGVLSLLLSGKGASLVCEKDKNGRTPLHLAVLGARSLGAVKFLLQFNSFVDAKDIDGQTPLHYVAGRSINYTDKGFDVDCLGLLLSSGASVQVVNNYGCNALSLALQRTMWWNRKSPRNFIINSVQLLVAKGSAIIDGFDMWRMVETFPSLVMVALNQSIKVNTSAKDSVHLKLVFDFRPLAVSRRLLDERKCKTIPLARTDEQPLPPALLNYNEIAMLHYIYLEGQKDMLRHPLCSAFLNLKWLRVRKFFILHILLYFIFVSIFTTYIMNLQDSSNRGGVREDAGMPGNFSKNSSNLTNETIPQMDFNPNMKSSLWIILMCFTIFFVVKEMFQIIHSPSIYFRCYENYIDILMLICILILLSLPENRFPITQRNISTIAVISSWVRLMLFLGQFPSCGVYVVMFSTVCSTVIRFLVMYVPLLIAFALGFQILLGEMNFKKFSTSFVTTLVMMTGEIDFKANFLENPNNPNLLSKIFSFLVLIVFLLLVYIILSNLLVALAVSDLHAIQQRSEILRLSRQVKLMVNVESFLKSPFIPSCLRNCLLKRFLLFESHSGGAIVIYPNKKYKFIENLYLKLLFIFRNRRLLTLIFQQFVTRFIPPWVEPSLPNSLIQEAIQTALRNFEIKKRDKLIYFKEDQSLLRRQCAYLKKRRRLNVQTASKVYTPPNRDSLQKNFNQVNEDVNTDFFSTYNNHCMGNFQQTSSILKANTNKEDFRNARDSISDSSQESCSEMEDLRKTISILRNTFEKLTQIYPFINADEQIKNVRNQQTQTSIYPLVKSFPNNHDVERDIRGRRANVPVTTSVQNSGSQVNIESSSNV